MRSISKEEIFVNKKYWENFNEEELNQFALKIFQYYRQNGYPTYDTSKKKSDFDKFIKYDISSMITDDGYIKQSMHGLGLLWSYFSHAKTVRCNNKLSPYEIFLDDEMFMNVIKKRLNIGTYISDSGILKMIKMYSKSQSVSNFRPTAAAAIYNKYAKNGVVWDMSCGWGGRLLGAIKSDIKKYIGTEPSTKTFEGLIELVGDFGSYRDDLKIELHMVGSETYIPNEPIDFCFTSPPYYDVEKYSDEPTQSYVKYDTYNKWLFGFLYKTIKHSYLSLKDGGYLAINIANTKNYNTIENDTLVLANFAGFVHVDTLNLLLSNANMKNRSSAYKTEPIFIFKKITKQS